MEAGNDSRQITDGGLGQRGWEAKEVNREILKAYQIKPKPTLSACHHLRLMTCLKENEVRACRLGQQKQLSVKNQNCSFMRFLIRWVLTHGLWADVLYLKHLGPKFLSEKLGVLME